MGIEIRMIVGMELRTSERLLWSSPARALAVLRFKGARINMPPPQQLVPTYKCYHISYIAYIWGDLYTLVFLLNYILVNAPA